MLSVDNQLLLDMLKNYQIQRHDFLNNFQVIKGYLQLNMPQKALAYIDEAVGELYVQQEIYQINQKTLMAVLLGWLFDLRLKGTEMNFIYEPDMKSEEFWKEHWQEEYALQFYGYTKDCLNLIPDDEDPEDLTAEVFLRTIPQGFTCDFRVLKQGELFKQHVFESESS